VNVEIFYVHADHLGTPRTVTRSTVATGANAPSSATSTSPGAINKAVWRWDSDPFGTSLGNSQPTENPQLITGTQTLQQAASFKQNLRFPGQLADGESAKNYNYFRDYDPSVGRYTTSDPLGLVGGINTFAYVENSPLTRVDPSGLIAIPIPAPPPPIVGPGPSPIPGNPGYPGDGSRTRPQSPCSDAQMKDILARKKKWCKMPNQPAECFPSDCM
jgi:RHS repeat-associated protein